MPNANHATLLHASHVGACLLLTFLIVALPARVRADELTGAPYDDPKDLSPTSLHSASSQSTDSTQFLSMPSWSRGAVMPPLPDQLKPMGKKPAVALTTPAPVVSPLAPPKDTTSATPAKEETTAQSKPAPTAPESPALIAVSPFLQWIKSNPQAAAAQARQEANGYNAQPAPAPAPANGPNGAAGAPYWLPPLIDSPDIVPNANGGSAAIYSTPQR